jgi:hypothetical protein
VRDLRLRDLHPVRRVHAEIGQLPGSIVPRSCSWNAAFADPVEARKAFVARQPLIESPVRTRETLERSARDGGIELDPRVASLDRRIGAARDRGAGVQELPPGIGAADACGPEPRRREQHVADGVRGLHRGDHAELREARDVGIRDDLGMLDAKTRVGDRAARRRHGGKRLSYWSRTTRLPRSPIACVSTWMPRLRAAVAMRRISSGGVHRPRLPGESLYGSSSAAPREPSARP